jgi:hypothetical protein
MTFSASTNLHNLMTHPAQVLLASAFWVSSAWMFVPIAAALVLVVGTAERLLGSVRTVLVFVVGHVGATLVTVAGIAVGVAHGDLPRSLAYAIDVGPSYGVAAVGAVLIARTADARRRHVTAALLAVALVLVVVVDRTFTDVGHLVAALLAFLAARAGLVSRAGGHDGGTELVAPVEQRRLVVQPEPARGQRDRVEVSDVRNRLVPLGHQRSGRTGRNGEPGALGEVLLLAGPAVVGRAPVRQDRRDAGPARVPRAGPPGERDATPGPGEAVRTGGVAGLHPVLLPGQVQRMAADPRLPALRTAPDGRVLDGKERAAGEHGHRIRAP